MHHVSVLRLAAACVALAVSGQAQSLPTIPSSLDAIAATSDQALYPAAWNRAIYLPGIADQLMFQPAARFVQDRVTGTARLTGRAVERKDNEKGFDVVLDFSGLTAIPPAGSPKRELVASAYVENGGPIDTSLWYYYPGFTGTLTGIGSWTGGQLTLTGVGAATQVGEGASNKNARHGAGTWFSYTVDSSPATATWLDGVGDLNVNLLGDCTCASGSMPDLSYTLDLGMGALCTIGGFGCDTEWHVVGDAVADIDVATGTVRLLGEIVAQGDPNCGFYFDLTLQGRVAPGDASYPPVGSPFLAKTQSSGLYVNGGSVDHDSWVYYQDIAGTLVGVNGLDGARVTVSNQASGLAAQVGVGAGRNTGFGAYVPVALVVDQQPTTGPALLPLDAELWLDLGECSGPVLLPQLDGPFPSLPTVTDDSFLLRGVALDTITQVQFGTQVITSQDPCDFGIGYFEILDSCSMRFYPPLCLDPATLPFFATDANGASSDAISLVLVEPAQPTLACAGELEVGCTQSLYLWGGPTGPLAFCVLISTLNQPSEFPPFFSLGIGANFTELASIDGMHPNCFAQLLGVVPANLAGITFYFQAIAIDPNNITLPLPTTNVCSTTYSM